MDTAELKEIMWNVDCNSFTKELKHSVLDVVVSNLYGKVMISFQIPHSYLCVLCRFQPFFYSHFYLHSYLNLCFNIRQTIAYSYAKKMTTIEFI